MNVENNLDHVPSAAPAIVDNHDQRRVDYVYPKDWQNPEPRKDYHLVVIGGGSAGLITAAGAAGVGAKVALIERHNLGGDCLNSGCVPSKAVIQTARRLSATAGAPEFGIEAAAASFDFAAAMTRMRKLRADISVVDSATRYQEELGVDVFLGDAQFVEQGLIRLDGHLDIPFKKAVIATGASAAAPPIPGLDEIDYLTNESVFNLTELPKRLVVIGAGPIGCELAQSFARFGTQVEVVDVAGRILANDDADAAEVVQKSLEQDGVVFHLGAQITQINQNAEVYEIALEVDSVSREIQTERVLVAAGRRPNTDGLCLENVGVEYDAKGICVDQKLRTSNRKIFACGDIALPLQFTHMADASARLVIQNALFFGRKKWTDLVVPWVTFTSPEVAHVGKTQQQLDQAHIEYDDYKVMLDDVDRAILDGQTEGYVSVLTKKGSDEILGATIVAEHAGEMINEITLAMTSGLGLGALANVIHPYPTQAEGIKKAADAYNRTRLTPLAAKFLKLLLKLQ